MTHATPLIATVVAGLVLAFILGAIAFRLKASPLVGYLLAGVIVGPFTPGYVADQGLANELAELGVILLMFGVGLHFSTRDLMAVKNVAIPGATAQIAVATVLGVGLGHLMGWSMAGSIVFGLSLSVASTVVLLRALQDRRLVDTQRGRIAIGWLIVEDLVMVFTLVMLPALGGAQSGPGLLSALLVTAAKVGAFVAFMLIVGRRVIPWALHAIAHTGSRELFRLAVLAIALGVAFGAAHLFSVSFALGAFFAGMILAGSQLSQRAADETLPLRDAFAVLFFVSVGMLFNPAILLTQALPLLGTLTIILVGKSIAAFMIIRAFGRDRRTAFTIAASLAQIGEFSFILASLGTSLELMPAVGRDLILAGAMISILLNPVLFVLIDRFCGAGADKELDGPARPPAEAPAAVAEARHVVLIGYGRVGAMVGAGLMAAGKPFVVIETQNDIDALPRDKALDVIIGNAANPKTLERADLAKAWELIVAIPQVFEAGQIVQQARAINPGLSIIARAHSDEEVAHLERCGADVTIMGEREIAKRMIDYATGVVIPS